MVKYQKPEKRVVGYVQGVCSRHGGDNERLTQYDGQWFCSLCLMVYKDSLLAPDQIEDAERQKTDFDRWTTK